ncbi:MAG: hypothetical protein WDN31_22360 [Hyphomicrobium sp.]
MVVRGGGADHPYGKIPAQRLDGEAAKEIGDDEGHRAPQPHAAIVEPLAAHATYGHRLDERQHGAVGQQEGDAEGEDGPVAGGEPEAGDHGECAPGKRQDHPPVVASQSARNPTEGVTRMRMNRGAAVTVEICRGSRPRACSQTGKYGTTMP